MRSLLSLRIAICSALLLFLSGCAAGYSSYVSRSLNQLRQGNYAEALNRLEKPNGKTNMLLYRMERGLIFHYQGLYAQSNAEFERAERLIDRLYTRSVSREAAAFLTNDAIVAYRGEGFERVFIHYYRALNYERLGDRQAVLVECRKANLKLASYAQKAEYQLSYKNDAFMQYATGLFFDSEGEWNDAYISYKDAEKGYRAYREAFGISIPRMLLVDLVRVAQKLGYSDEVRLYTERYRLRPEELQPPPNGEVIVFIESGFVPRKQQNEMSIPILKDDRGDAIWTISERAVDRYNNHYVYHNYAVDYWLSLALPHYKTASLPLGAVRLRNGQNSTMGVLAEDLDVIARRTLEQKLDHILLRTVARATAKYLASKSIEKTIANAGDDEDDRVFNEGLGELVGGLFNLLGNATEAADTRGWLSLPRTVYIARLPTGGALASLQIEVLDPQGRVIHTQDLLPVEQAEGDKTFLSTRVFR